MALQMLRSTPSFTVTLRGYDKDEVDDYIESLRDRQGDEVVALEAADRTIRSLEAEVRNHADRVARLESCVKGESPRTIAALGERLTMILEQAETSATETVALAQQEAESTREEAALAADRITGYATFQASEAEARAAATTRGAEERARQLEDDARRKASDILDEAEAQAESRIAEINHWVGRVRTQIKAEQIQAADEFASTRARREAELHEVAARHDSLLASLNAVCESVTETVSAHRAADHLMAGDLGSSRRRTADSSLPFDQAIADRDAQVTGDAENDHSTENSPQLSVADHRDNELPADGPITATILTEEG